jgi:hypothetical protein
MSLLQAGLVAALLEGRICTLTQLLPALQQELAVFQQPLPSSQQQQPVGTPSPEEAAAAAAADLDPAATTTTISRLRELVLTMASRKAYGLKEGEQAHVWHQSCTTLKCEDLDVLQLWATQWITQ